MRMLRIVACIIVIIASAGVAYAGSDTVFTYQGHLLDGGVPANGLFNFEFGLWDADVGGTLLTAPNIHNAVLVTDGLFVILLDFGANDFGNSDRWLEIEVDGMLLTPRQPITRVPYSIQTRGIVVGIDGIRRIADALFDHPLRGIIGHTP